MVAFSSCNSAITGMLSKMSTCGDAAAKAAPTAAGCGKSTQCCYVEVSVASDTAKLCVKAINEKAAQGAFDASFAQVKKMATGMNIGSPKVTCSSGGSSDSGSASGSSANFITLGLALFASLFLF